jgi:hypothetical protein
VQISAMTPNPATAVPADAPVPETTPQAAEQTAVRTAGDAPAVTVTLSPEAQAAQKAAQAAPAAMPMADAVKTLTAGAQSGPLTQIKSLLLKLADGSGASKIEQVQAYVDLHKLVLLDPDKTWYAQSTTEDRKAYAAIMDGGAISNEIRQAADDFNHWSMSQDMRSNVPRKNLEHLNAMSSLEQQMVFAGTVGWDMASLDQWKAQMQVDIVNVDKMIALDEAEKKPGKSKATTQAKDGAKAAETGTTASEEASPEAQALAALTSPGQGDGVAAAALKMLRKAAEARAEAKEQAEQARKDDERTGDTRTEAARRAVLEPYVIGDKVDKAV